MSGSSTATAGQISTGRSSARSILRLVAYADCSTARPRVPRDSALAKIPCSSARIAGEQVMLSFGITLKPDMAPERIVALTHQAEEAGFDYGWVFDSHVLWLEPYPLLTMMALNTTRMRLGTCVTNPAVRDPSVTASLHATLN